MLSFVDLFLLACCLVWSKQILPHCYCVLRVFHLSPLTFLSIKTFLHMHNTLSFLLSFTPRHMPFIHMSFPCIRTLSCHSTCHPCATHMDSTRHVPFRTLHTSPPHATLHTHSRSHSPSPFTYIPFLHYFLTVLPLSHLLIFILFFLFYRFYVP